VDVRSKYVVEARARFLRSWWGIVVGIAISAWSSGAWASVACPTTQTSSASLLKIYGYDMSRFNSGYKQDVYIGNFMFYGTSVVGAVVVEENIIQTLNTCNIYVVTDANGNLLAGLPRQQNYLCLGDADQFVEVISVSTKATQLDHSCSALTGITMAGLNYAGNWLDIMVLGGADHVHGGAFGMDTIYGGTGSDDLDSEGTQAQSPANVDDVVFGEEGNDFLYGGHGDYTWLAGGPDVDQLIDVGGVGDYLEGDDANDCCIGDSNHNFSLLSGGAGTDRCDQLAGSTSCEIQDATDCDNQGSFQCSGTN